jgi:hypothetical protein
MRIAHSAVFSAFGGQSFLDQAIRQVGILNLPDNVYPLAVLCLGYASDVSRPARAGSQRLAFTLATVGLGAQ